MYRQPCPDYTLLHSGPKDGVVRRPRVFYWIGHSTDLAWRIVPRSSLRAAYGLTYAYEKGAFARVPLHWDDAAKTLTIGKREGSFEGALSERIFNLVLVSKQKPVSFSFSPQVDRTVHYSGDKVVAKVD